MKLTRTLAWFTLLLTGVCVWGGIVRHIYLGGTSLGSLTYFVKSFVEIPSSINNIISNFDEGPYTKLDNNLSEVNYFSEDLLVTGSFFDSQKNLWNVRLINLKTDSILTEWCISEGDLDGNLFLGYDGRKSFANHINFSHLRPFHPLALSSKSLIVMMDGSNNLLHIRNNQIVWQNNDFIFHHSINKSASGSSIWVCGTKHNPSGNNSAFINPGGSAVTFRDDFLVEIDIESGKTLNAISVAQTLVDNAFKGLLAVRLENDFDPIHLNDIEPVLQDGPYWSKGDLFCSLRNLNTVFLYRPASEKILWLKTGEFIAQHDVDILDSTRISVFNNNYLTPTKRTPIDKVDKPLTTISKESSSEYLTYDFSTETFETLHKAIFDSLQIISATEGLFETLPSGNIFIESQNAGKIYIINPNKGIVYQHQYKVELHSDLVHIPNWFRVYNQTLLDSSSPQTTINIYN